MQRAVITGLGPVTPIGIGKDAFYAGLQSGVSAVRRISSFDPSLFRSHIAAEVRDFDPNRYIDARRLRRMDRYSQFAVAAAGLALSDAGLDLTAVDRSRVGISIGSALGGTAYAEAQLNTFVTKGLRAVETTLAFSVFCGAGSCNIAITYGISGPVSANSNSCASGTIALGEALEWIRRGRADVVLAGGAEAPLAPLCYGAFALIRAMSSRNHEPEFACRPFDAHRDGFVMGEGAAMLVVEELQHARARGAHIYGELIGYSLTNDAYHMTAPLPDATQATRAISLSLADAGIPAEEIDYVNAHGSSTLLNDRMETAALKHALGKHAYRIPISSTKGHHAHPLGASGAIEAAACALTLEHAYIPPTVNLEHPDLECDLDYTPRVGRRQQIRTILSDSFGFGGINACLVMRKVEEES